jgi:hypothetical protein
MTGWLDLVLASTKPMPGQQQVITAAQHAAASALASVGICIHPQTCIHTDSDCNGAKIMAGWGGVFAVGLYHHKHTALQHKCDTAGNGVTG